MVNEFVGKIIPVLQQSGYNVFVEPRHIPGVPALLYACSAERYRQAFAKVEDHFAFIDWENAAFGNLEHLKAIYQALSTFANRNFPVPHALRMQIPNLAVAALSPYGFPAEVIQFAKASSLGPWYGGETGQVLLADLARREVTIHRMSRIARYPERGALPLMHAARVLEAACKQSF